MVCARILRLRGRPEGFTFRADELSESEESVFGGKCGSWQMLPNRLEIKEAMVNTNLNERQRMAHRGAP